LAGALTLFLRQLFGMALTAVSTILLARWLTVRDFGLYAQVAFWSYGAVALVLGDLGLGLSLVRSQDEPAPKVWAAATAVSAMLAIVALCTGVLTVLVTMQFFHTWNPAWVVGLTFALSARFSRIVPAASLLRRAAYGSIAKVELIESLVYFAVTLLLAASGWGATALIAGMTMKELVGAGALWTLIGGPRPRPGFNALGTLRPFVRTGLHYQATGILTTSTDAFQPLIIGSVLGPVPLGYVSWSYSLILIPILLLGSVDRVVVPTLAQVQTYPRLLAAWTETFIRMNGLIALPVGLVLLLCTRQVVSLVFAPRWLPTVELIQLFVPAIVAVTIFAPLINAFNALGRTEVALHLSAGWAVLTYTVGTLAVATGGIRGYGWFYVGLQVTYIYVVLRAARLLQVRWWRTAGPLAVGAGAASAAAWLSPMEVSWHGLAVRTTAMTLAFYSGYVASHPGQAVADFAKLRALIRNRSAAT